MEKMQENISANDTDYRTFKITIFGFDSGLNELLNGVHYDSRTRRIVNLVKRNNDDLIMKQIRFSNLRNVRLKTPVQIHYRFLAKDRRRDRSNIAAGFIKSFEDACQKVGILENDSWEDVYESTCEFWIDKEHPRVEVEIREVSKRDDLSPFKFEGEEVSTKSFYGASLPQNKARRGNTKKGVRKNESYFR